MRSNNCCATANFDVFYYIYYYLIEKNLHSDADEIRTSSSESDTSEDEVWDEESVDELHHSSEGAPQLPSFKTSSSSAQWKLVKWFVVFILLFQSKYYVSDSAMYLIPQLTVF